MITIVRLLLLSAVVALIGWGCEEAAESPTEPTKSDIRFYKVAGDLQPCNAMDTLAVRFTVQLDSGDNLPLTWVNLTFNLVEGSGQPVAKPTGEAGVTVVKTLTDLLGEARVNFQSFSDCQSKVRVTVDTMPELQLEFTINPGITCPPGEIDR